MNKKDELPTDPYGAFRAMVYSHGVPYMARLMGLKKGSLYNKADADIESQAQPTLRDLITSAQGSGDYSVLDALDEMFGRAAFDTHGHENKSDEALLELVITLSKENSEFLIALHQSLVAKKFSRDGMNLIRSEAFDIIRALLTLVHRAEGLVDD